MVINDIISLMAKENSPKQVNRTLYGHRNFPNELSSALILFTHRCIHYSSLSALFIIHYPSFISHPRGNPGHRWAPWVGCGWGNRSRVVVGRRSGRNPGARLAAPARSLCPGERAIKRRAKHIIRYEVTRGYLLVNIPACPQKKSAVFPFCYLFWKKNLIKLRQNESEKTLTVPVLAARLGGVRLSSIVSYFGSQVPIDK